MTEVDRIKYLRVVLVVVGLIFILGGGIGNSDSWSWCGRRDTPA